MRYYKPDYYDDFKCIDKACPKTCCAGWEIEDGIDLINGRCENLRDDGLCQLIIDQGEGVLCDTCRDFPRHLEEFENVREYSLSISCPVVADLILKRRDPVQFISKEDLEFDQEEYDDYEQQIALYLRDLRVFLKQILWDNSQPLVLRCIQILHVAADFQDEMDEILLGQNDIDEFDSTEFIARYMSDSHRYINTSMSYASYREAAKDMFQIMLEWEYTDPKFGEYLHQVYKKLFALSEEDFNQLCSDVTDFIYNHEQMSEIMNIQVISYFLDTFFVGSCYDEYYYGQAQLAVVAGLQITLLFMAEYMDKGDQLSIEDAIITTYTFARELEHSTPNFIASEKWADEHRLI